MRRDCAEPISITRARVFISLFVRLCARHVTRHDAPARLTKIGRANKGRRAAARPTIGRRRRSATGLPKQLAADSLAGGQLFQAAISPAAAAGHSTAARLDSAGSSSRSSYNYCIRRTIIFGRLRVSWNSFAIAIDWPPLVSHITRRRRRPARMPAKCLARSESAADSPDRRRRSDPQPAPD